MRGASHQAAALIALALVLPAGAGAAERDLPYTVPEAPPHCGARFCVHYVREGRDAPELTDAQGATGVPDFVEAVADAAGRARKVLNGRLDWPAPRSDGTLGGGSGLTDIYVVDLPGISGATSLDAGRRARSSYIELSNRLDTDSDNLAGVHAVVAHEYGHVLEHVYSAGQDGWMSEGTAEWMADQVRPHTSLPHAFDWTQQSRIPMTSSRRAYQGVVFNHWVAHRYGRGVVRRAWSLSRRTRPPNFAPAAYDRAIRERPGPGFLAEGLGFWREFALLAAVSAEWRTAGLPQARVWADMHRAGVLRRGTALRRRIDHTAYLLYDVPPPTVAGGALVLRVSVQRDTKSAVALVGRRGPEGGHVVRRLRWLRRGGTTELTLPAPAFYERITAVLVNADASARRGFRDWRYTRDRRLFTARLTLARRR